MAKPMASAPTPFPNRGATKPRWSLSSGLFLCRCIVEAAAACRRTPIRAPIREPRHTTWPYLHVCTRGGSCTLETLGTPGSRTFVGVRSPFAYVHALPRGGVRLFSIVVCCSCSGTCAFSHTRAVGVDECGASTRAPAERWKCVESLLGRICFGTPRREWGQIYLLEGNLADKYPNG